VGLGFGAEFIPIYQSHPQATVAAICRRNAAELNKVGDALGIEKRYTSYDDVLADPDIDLISIRREEAVVENKPDALENKSGKEDNNEAKTAKVAGKYLKDESEYQTSVMPQKQDPDSVVGVLLNANVDADHWLGAGVASTIKVLAMGSDIYTPIRLDKGVNVARFNAPDDLRVSGYLWEENRKQLAFKPFVAAQSSGRGFVIAFTQDPNFRAYLDGLNVIFMNAIFRSAAHARPVR